tara:strand:+ start:206 stop:2941 length:2736 start_codon:yes stop_codon:yes gene_type:complete
MPKMYSVSKKEWIDVPEAQVQQAYASGDFVFAKGERVHVALPDGRYGSVLGEDFGEAVRAGATYDLASDRQERVEKAEYEGKNVEALLLAAGRGLTFGLSDVALEKMGAYSNEELENIEEYNSVLSGVGEIGGMLLPAVFTGGTTAVAGAGIKGAAKKAIAQTPAGFAARSAAAAEKGVAKLFGVEGAVGGSKMLRAAPGMAAAGGVEGALFGAGETFSEELLGRTDKTAEQIMGDITTSALLGGGLTAAFSAPAAVVAKAFQSQAKTKYPTGLAKKVADFKDKYTAAMTGLDTELLSKTRDPKFLDDYLGFKQTRDDLSVASRNHIGEMFDTVHGTTKAVTDEKYRVILPKIKPSSEFGTIDESINVLDNYIRSLKEVTVGDSMATGAASKLVNEASKAKSEIVNLINNRIGAGAATILEDGSVDIALDISSKSLGGMAKDIFKIVDQLKIKQSRYDRGLTGFEGLRKFLEDASFFGKEAAESQAMLNAAWTKLIGHQKNFRKRFMTKNEAAGPGEPQYIADSSKIDSFINGLHADEGRLYTKAQMFDEYVSSFSTYVDAAKSVGLKIDDVAPNIVTASNNLKSKWSDFKYLQEAKKELDSLSKQPGLVSETFATVGGYAFGGLPGALAARYIRNIASPGDAVRRRITAHRMKSEINKQIDQWAVNATKRTMGNITAPFKDLKVSKRASLMGLIGAKLTGDSEQDTVKEIEALSTISDPSVLAARLEENLGSLEDAPMLKQQIIADQIKKVELVKAAAQKASVIAIDPMTGEQRVVVSDADAANFRRALNAIAGPALAQLHTEIMSGPPTEETIKNTEAANPLLFGRYVEGYNENIRKAVEKGEKISFRARETWARLNKQPTVPANIGAAMQAVYKNTGGQQGAPRQGQAVAGLKGIANRSVTPVTRAIE